jgi:putative nucleotidyltransferase with HDIG domain
MPPASSLHLRELPAVAAATALVSVVPAAIAAALLPPHSAAAVGGSIVLAVALSALAARAGAAAWSRIPGARDMLFADLMAWTWLRRRVSERRLARVRRAVLESHPGREVVPAGALVRMGRLLEARDTYTYGHSRRVARHAQTIARGMRLPEAQVEQIRQAALLHDIGKIYTPREIIEKPGRLTDEEFAVIRAHPVDGAALLTHLDEPAIVAIVRHHHERLDGRGYPAGLRGDDIPLGARIVAVADTFDALTSARAYRRAQTHKHALAILEAESGTQLDADAVASFMKHYSAGRPAVVAAMLSAAGERVVSLLAGAGAGLAPGAAAVAAAGATFALGYGGAARMADRPAQSSARAAEVAAVTPSGGGVVRPVALAPLTARPAAAGATVAAAYGTGVGTARRGRRGAAGDGGATQAEGGEDVTTSLTTTTTTGGGDAASPAAKAADDGGATHAEGSEDAAQDTGGASGTTHAEGAQDRTSTSAGSGSGSGSHDTGGGTTTTTTTTTTSRPPATTTTTTTTSRPPPTTTTTTTPAPRPAASATTTVAVSTPAVTTPAITVPAVTTPVLTTPAVTVPAVTVPPVGVGVGVSRSGIAVTLTLPGQQH